MTKNYIPKAQWKSSDFTSSEKTIIGTVPKKYDRKVRLSNFNLLGTTRSYS